MVYVSPNLWVGMCVVLATIVWLCLAAIHAFDHRNAFSLGFAIGASSWIIFWLGFTVEIPPGWTPWDLGHKIVVVANAFRPIPAFDAKVPVNPTHGLNR